MFRIPEYRQCKILLCSLASGGLVLSQAALAADDELELVEVIGQRAMMQSATARQRDSDVVESVLTRDAIGQFPDQNVAESARRLQGINILDDQGEGRFVSVRGLDPTLNAASVNGVRLPAPEADTRAVALDVIPTELVESIEVKKTLTPDMDADTIGASIEINTIKAFDRKDLFHGGTLETSHNDLNGKSSPKASIDFSVPVSETFGIAGGLSYYDRKTSTDNTEMGDWGVSEKVGSEGVVYAGTVEYRDYDVERERIGGSLSFDWKPTGTTALYARTIYSQFDDTEKRGRLTFSMQGEPVSGDADTAIFTSSTSAGTGSRRVRVRRDLKDRFESQKIQSYQFGGATDTGPWNLKYQLAYSEAEEHEHQTQDPTRFERDVTATGALSVGFDYSNLHTTDFSILAGQAGFDEASGYNFAEVDAVDGLSQDKEWSAKVDAAHTLAFGSGELELKSGLKVRLRDKTYMASNQIYDGFSGDGGYSLADVAGGQTYGLAELGVLPDRSQVRAFNEANLGSFDLSADDSFLASVSGAYGVREDIYAGYLQGKYKANRLTLIGGVRVEYTQDYLDGNLVDEDAVSAVPVYYRSRYTDVLPGVNLKYDATDAVVVRAALFASLVRPGIGQMAPHSAINEDLEATFGNPDLDPYQAWNLDLSAEYYPAPGAVLQLGVFYKDIKDFIATQTFDDTAAPYNGSFQGIAFSEASIPINGDSAKVQGAEFNFQRALDTLPGALNGLLVGFNYTYTDAKGKVQDGAGQRSIPLPAAAQNTYNAMLGYEKGGLSLRLTGSYRDEYLDELGSGADSDRFVKDRLQIDASAKYRFSEQIQGFIEGINLNNEPYVAYRKGPVRDRLLQFETYSWTVKAGVRVTF